MLNVTLRLSKLCSSSSAMTSLFSDIGTPNKVKVTLPYDMAAYFFLFEGIQERTGMVIGPEDLWRGVSMINQLCGGQGCYC